MCHSDRTDKYGKDMIRNEMHLSRNTSYHKELITQYGTGILDLDVLSLGSYFENAISNTGYGRFHYKLIALCGLVYLDTALEVTLLSFVLPAAKCDFHMSSSDSGLLTAAPMLGMVCGSYLWGSLADLRGRKLVLVCCLLVDGVSGLASSISPWYPLFLFCRFLSGFAITGAMGTVFPYLGEFQPTKYREKVLSWMEIFWTFGVITLPLVAWAIIPLPIHYHSRFLRMESWNVFVALCSLPSLLLALWLTQFPESPCYLLEAGDNDGALHVLRQVYAENTGDIPENYTLKFTKEKMQSEKTQLSRSLKSVRSMESVKVVAWDMWHMARALWKPPHLRCTTLTCLIQFGLSSGYFTLTMWLPELFHRFQRYQTLHPDSPTSVCQVSSVFVGADGPCDPTIHPSVYLQSLAIGLACVPTSLCLPLCVHRIGLKVFLVICLLGSGAVSMGLYFVHNSMQNLVLSCVFEALTSLGISIMYCIMVDLFPTNLRVVATAMSVTFGRCGALIGNLIFGFLIDLNCVVTIITISTLLFGSGILSLFLPSTGKGDLH